MIYFLPKSPYLNNIKDVSNETETNFTKIDYLGDGFTQKDINLI